jgi:TMEM199 family protein
MVLLTATPQIVSLLATLPPLSLSRLPSQLPKDASDPIEHTTLIRLAQLSQTSLNSLLRGTRPYFPPPKPKPQPSAEYLALKARLLAQQEQREYNQILHKQQREEDEDVGEDNIPISLPFNILVSILCCGGAVFYMTRYWNNAGLRVLLSLGVAILVGVAEVVVYAGYLRKVMESKLKERRKKDMREIVPLSAEDEKAIVNARTTGTTEKDAIWGRGVNGGMRRRVREKWEKEQEGNEMSEDGKSK